MAEDAAQIERVFDAVVLAAFADGEPSGAELKTLQETLAQHPEFAAQHELRPLLLDVYRRIRELGADALLDSIVDGLPDRRYQELAYSLASRVIAADGKTAAGEATMLRRLQERFGFTDEDVLRLLL
jgi:hypothetical protein